MKSKFIFTIVILTFIACNQNVDSENDGAEQQVELQQIQVEEIEDKDFGNIGFELMETETIGDLKIGLTTDEVEAIVGEPSETTPFEFWEADGLEHQARVYQNKTIELDFIKLEAGKIVSNSITISEGCKYKTSRNIGIGSTHEEVFQAYKAEISTPEMTSTLVAGTIYGGIIFQFSEGSKVNNIFIGSAAE
jgi:orotate phosphoribosyltransferase-like protein